MNISHEGLRLIKRFEGKRLVAYKAVPTEKYFTIGYGHYGADVAEGMKITESRATELLIEDVKESEEAVRPYIQTYDLTQSQFDALVSFTFNCGKGNLKKLTDNGKRLKVTVAEKLLEYNKAGGKVLKGLQNRREAEHELFTRGMVAQRKPNNVVAYEVIKGYWGNGSQRKERLEASGYNYTEVQALVNEILKKGC